MSCPCNPQVLYSGCCETFHSGLDIPHTAEQLMRSRYSAFVLGLIDYIVQTTLPSQQRLLNQAAIAEWSTQTDWQGLEVLNHLASVGKRHAQVEFKATFKTPNGIQVHHELSTFVKVVEGKQSRWYFLDPTVNNTIIQKQPCLCNSGKKFKHCCSKFL